MAMNQASIVAELSDEQRRVLESVIGQSLEDDQVVHWSITTDGRQSTAEAKAAEEENTPPVKAVSHDEFMATLRAIIALHPRSNGSMDDSRESIYAGRGE